MRNLSIILTLFAAILIGTALVPDARAQDTVEKPKVKLQVDGLACPFCAYGLEKKLKKLKGVTAVDVHIDEGFVLLTLNEGAGVTDEKIRSAVADAGFTAREITRPATGGPAAETG